MELFFSLLLSPFSSPIHFLIFPLPPPSLLPSLHPFSPLSLPPSFLPSFLPPSFLLPSSFLPSLPPSLPLQAVESGISSHTPSVASLNAAGEKLIGSSSTENTAEIQEDLKGLNER